MQPVKQEDTLNHISVELAETLQLLLPTTWRHFITNTSTASTVSQLSRLYNVLPWNPPDTATGLSKEELLSEDRIDKLITLIQETTQDIMFRGVGGGRYVSRVICELLSDRQERNEMVLSKDIDEFIDVMECIDSLRRSLLYLRLESTSDSWERWGLELVNLVDVFMLKAFNHDVVAPAASALFGKLVTLLDAVNPKLAKSYSSRLIDGPLSFLLRYHLRLCWYASNSTVSLPPSPPSDTQRTVRVGELDIPSAGEIVLAWSGMRVVLSMTALTSNDKLTIVSNSINYFIQQSSFVCSFYPPGRICLIYPLGWQVTLYALSVVVRCGHVEGGNNLGGIITTTFCNCASQFVLRLRQPAETDEETVCVSYAMGCWLGISRRYLRDDIRGGKWFTQVVAEWVKGVHDKEGLCMSLIRYWLKKSAKDLNRACSEFGALLDLVVLTPSQEEYEGMMGVVPHAIFEWWERGISVELSAVLLLFDAPLSSYLVNQATFERYIQLLQNSDPAKSCVCSKIVEQYLLTCVYCCYCASLSVNQSHGEVTDTAYLRYIYRMFEEVDKCGVYLLGYLASSQLFSSTSQTDEDDAHSNILQLIEYIVFRVETHFCLIGCSRLFWHSCGMVPDSIGCDDQITAVQDMISLDAFWGRLCMAFRVTAERCRERIDRVMTMGRITSDRHIAEQVERESKTMRVFVTRVNKCLFNTFSSVVNKKDFIKLSQYTALACIDAVQSLSDVLKVVLEQAQQYKAYLCNGSEGASNPLWIWLQAKPCVVNITVTVGGCWTLCVLVTLLADDRERMKAFSVMTASQTLTEFILENLMSSDKVRESKHNIIQQRVAYVEAGLTTFEFVSGHMLMTLYSPHDKVWIISNYIAICIASLSTHNYWNHITLHNLVTAIQHMFKGIDIQRLPRKFITEGSEEVRLCNYIEACWCVVQGQFSLIKLWHNQCQTELIATLDGCPLSTGLDIATSEMLTYSTSKYLHSLLTCQQVCLGLVSRAPSGDTPWCIVLRAIHAGITITRNSAITVDIYTIVNFCRTFERDGIEEENDFGISDTNYKLLTELSKPYLISCLDLSRLRRNLLSAMLFRCMESTSNETEERRSRAIPIHWLKSTITSITHIIYTISISSTSTSTSTSSSSSSSSSTSTSSSSSSSSTSSSSSSSPSSSPTSSTSPATWLHDVLNSLGDIGKLMDIGFFYNSLIPSCPCHQPNPTLHHITPSHHHPCMLLHAVRSLCLLCRLLALLWQGSVAVLRQTGRGGGGDRRVEEHSSLALTLREGLVLCSLLLSRLTLLCLTTNYVDAVSSNTPPVYPQAKPTDLHSVCDDMKALMRRIHRQIIDVITKPLGGGPATAKSYEVNNNSKSPGGVSLISHTYTQYALLMASKDILCRVNNIPTLRVLNEYLMNRQTHQQEEVMVSEDDVICNTSRGLCIRVPPCDECHVMADLCAKCTTSPSSSVLHSMHNQMECFCIPPSQSVEESLVRRLCKSGGERDDVVVIGVCGDAEELLLQIMCNFKYWNNRQQQHNQSHNICLSCDASRSLEEMRICMESIQRNHREIQKGIDGRLSNDSIANVMRCRRQIISRGGMGGEFVYSTTER
eukprot:GHVQ01040643.1.p1 GENE.GHVQ01040643.1~~GHVQ01040643.1.p1  ORF type:complete len:1739 (-),score=264.96 GHVQ01040643.1:3178-7944(-)